MRFIEAVGQSFMYASVIWVMYIIIKVAYKDWKNRR